MRAGDNRERQETRDQAVYEQMACLARVGRDEKEE